MPRTPRHRSPRSPGPTHPRPLETGHDARRTAAAGRSILDDVYDGDVAAFQSKDNTKGRSLLTLAGLLGRSVGRVWGMVATAIVYEGLPKELRDQLTPTHIEALYSGRCRARAAGAGGRRRGPHRRRASRAHRRRHRP